MFIPIALSIIAGIVCGSGFVLVYNKKNESGGKAKAEDLIRKAKNEAADIVLKAKRSEKLGNKEREIDDLKLEIHQIRDKQQEKLEKIAGLTKLDAKDKLIKMTEKDIKDDLVGLITKEQKELRRDIDETAQALLVTAMERMSSEVTADRTVTALKLPDDEMKGRIIGKEGRNIQALQRATGVDIMVDDTPGMVVLSSFDPIRRQVARYALERLMKDGRINPSSIEV